MRMSLENIGRRLSRAPMLKALVPLVAGIVVAGRWSLPLWGAAAGLVVCVAAGVVWRHRARADLFIAAAMFFAGWCAAQMRPAVQAPQGERVMELTVDEVLTRRDGVTLAEGRIVAFASGRDVERCGAVVRIWADGSLSLREGERLEALCRVRPFADNGYGRYMLRQGVAGSVSLDSMRVIRRMETPLRWARRLHHKAVGRISQLGLDTPTQAVVAAMAVGDRSGLTPELRDRYARSGTSHLLAVSGLHVGFVFIIVNLLLMWMLTLWYGYAVRCLVVVAAIWVYAAVTGFSPSVVRAAVMFSVFQVSMALTVSLGETAFGRCPVAGRRWIPALVPLRRGHTRMGPSDLPRNHTPRDPDGLRPIQVRLARDPLHRPAHGARIAAVGMVRCDHGSRGQRRDGAAGVVSVRDGVAVERCGGPGVGTPERHHGGCGHGVGTLPAAAAAARGGVGHGAGRNISGGVGGGLRRK